jgi:hypothetical protein
MDPGQVWKFQREETFHTPMRILTTRPSSPWPSGYTDHAIPFVHYWSRSLILLLLLLLQSASNWVTLLFIIMARNIKQGNAMSSNNETDRLIVKLHTESLFLSILRPIDSTQHYAESRPERAIGMQSLCSYIDNIDNGTRTSIKVSESRHPLVFW